MDHGPLSPGHCGRAVGEGMVNFDHGPTSSGYGLVVIRETHQSPRRCSVAIDLYSKRRVDNKPTPAPLKRSSGCLLVIVTFDERPGAATQLSQSSYESLWARIWLLWFVTAGIASIWITVTVDKKRSGPIHPCFYLLSASA